MAGFARLQESMANYYLGKSSTNTAPLNSISETPSESTQGATSSDRKHSAPGGGSSATRSRLHDSDSEEEPSKNSSFASYQSRSPAGRAPLRPESAIDDGVTKRRPRSPRPVESSQRSSKLSPRSSLRVPTDGAVEGSSGSRSPNRLTVGEGKQRRQYDSTDNMRLGVKDDSSSSENSDARRNRPTDKSSWSSSRRQAAATDKSDPDFSQGSGRLRSHLRDEGSPLPHRRNLDSKHSEDDSPPLRSSFRDETSIRRRKKPDETVQDNEIPALRGSPRAALKQNSRDDLPVRRRKDVKADRDSPPLRSSYREEPLSRRKEPMSSKDDLPVRRRKIIEDDSDSPPSRVAARDKFRSSMTSERRDQSPPSRLSPRNESSPRRKNDADEQRSDSLSLSRSRDLSRTSNDAEDLPLRRRRDFDARSGSPPLKSFSREEPLTRHRGQNSKNGIEDLSVPRRNDPMDERGGSPPPRSKREESLSRRKNTIDDNEDLERHASDDLPVRRRNALGMKSGRVSSPPLESSSGKDSFPSRSSSIRDPTTPQRFPLKAGPLSRSKDRDKSSDSESPPRKREDSSELRRLRDTSPPPSASRVGYKSSSSLSPRRRDETSTKDDQQKPGKASVRPKSGYRSNFQQRGDSGPSETNQPQSRFRGDKEQPKSGVLNKPALSPRPESIENKKPYSLKPSDPERSSEIKGTTKREDIKSPVHPKSGVKDGRSLSPPSRSASKSFRDEISPRSGKGLDLSQPKTESRLRPLDSRTTELEKRKEGGKGLSPRVADKDDSLSPRRSALRVDKGDKKELSYLRSDSKTASRDDFSLRRQQQSPGSDIPPPRTAEQFVKRGMRDEEASAKLGSKDPSAFEFSRYETQKLRIVKLKRSLPANLSSTRYALVEEAARYIGFVRTNKDDFKTPFLIWNDTFISTERLTQLKPFQRVNHFPGMAQICRKDLLAKNMDKLYQRYPSEYKFVPRAWCLPDELVKFRQHVQERKSELKPSYICKPVDGASGRGIKIYKTAEEVPQTVENECVLQEYVSNPFLIENVKFDLRLYVLITSCDPLRIYMSNDGFLRMSSEPYVELQKCKADEDLAFMHLTNCSVNKQNRPRDTFDSSRRKGTTISGMKRPLMFLNTYLQQNKYDVASVWRKIVDLIVKTVFAAYPHIVRSYRQCRPADSPGSSSACFELLGFDILLDADLKPWLLEVNRSPSFDYENSKEEEMKLQLLEETLMLLNVSPADWKPAKQTTECPPVSAQMAQKEVVELTSLLARLKRQDRMKDADALVCQRFRRVFPVDDAAKQEKLASLMLDAISALLEGSHMEALHREVKIFHTSTANEVAKKLAQLGSKTVQQLMAEGEAASSDSGSEAEDKAGDRRGRLGLGGARRVASKDGAKKPRKKSQEKQKDQAHKHPKQSESMIASEREQLAQRTLKFLNELSIRFPGKSHRGAEQQLRQLQDDWRARKADVSSYWRLSLDADKRRKVIDIARQNVRVAVDKALRMTASDVTAAADNLARLFEKLYNRLLWCHGQGLWETFNGNTSWETILRQSREAPTDTEINCCRRVVQLCQDCLMVVYLFSDAAQQLQQKQQQQQLQQQEQQQQASVQLLQKPPLTVS